MNKGFSFTPKDAIEARAQELLAGIPSQVLDVWKAAIINNMRFGRSKVEERAIVATIASTMSLTSEEVRARGYMDVPDIFLAQGWQIQHWKDPSVFVFDSQPEKASKSDQSAQQQQDPISPALAAQAAAVTKVDGIPLEVIAVWNKLIIENYANGQSKVDLDTIAGAISHQTGRPVSEVLRGKWIQVFGVYQKQGWSVTLDCRCFVFTAQAN